MANYTLEQVFGEYLQLYGDKYPGITVSDMLDFNNKFEYFSNGAWRNEYNYKYMGDSEYSHYHIDNVINELNGVKAAGCTHVLTSDDKIVFFKQYEPTLTELTEQSEYALTNFIKCCIQYKSSRQDKIKELEDKIKELQNELDVIRNA